MQENPVRNNFEIRNCGQNDQNTPNIEVIPLKSGFLKEILVKFEILKFELNQMMMKCMMRHDDMLLNTLRP